MELLSAGRRVLQRLGIGDVRVRLSHTGVLRALLARAGFTPEEQVERYDRLLDGDLSAVREIEERLPELGAPLHLLVDLTGTDVGYLENIRAAFTGAVPEMGPALDELTLVARALAVLDCPFEIVMTLARDFEYYTGPVFRFVAADGTALGGGGRYDALVRRPSGEAVPACGFALFMERIGALLPAPELGRGGVVYVEPVAVTPESLGLALTVAEELQEAGFCAELVGSRRRPACRWVLTVDAAGGPRRYRLHDLDSGEQLTAASMDVIFTALGRSRC